MKRKVRTANMPIRAIIQPPKRKGLLFPHRLVALSLYATKRKEEEGRGRSVRSRTEHRHTKREREEKREGEKRREEGEGWERGEEWRTRRKERGEGREKREEEIRCVPPKKGWMIPEMGRLAVAREIKNGETPKEVKRGDICRKRGSSVGRRSWREEERGARKRREESRRRGRSLLTRTKEAAQPKFKPILKEVNIIIHPHSFNQYLHPVPSSLSFASSSFLFLRHSSSSFSEESLAGKERWEEGREGKEEEEESRRRDFLFFITVVVFFCNNVSFGEGSSLSSSCSSSSMSPELSLRCLSSYSTSIATRSWMAYNNVPIISCPPFNFPQGERRGMWSKRKRWASLWDPIGDHLSSLFFCQLLLPLPQPTHSHLLTS
jgi:hypothetical protein